MKNIFLLTSLLIVICYDGFSQEETVNSINVNFQELSLYKKKMKHWQTINIDSAIYYSQKFINKSKKEKYITGIIKGTKYLSDLLHNESNYSKEIEVLSDALIYLNNENYIIVKADFLYKMGEASRATEQFEAGIEYLEEAEKIYEANNKYHKLAKTYNRTAAILHQLSDDDFSKAFTYIDNSIKIAEESEDFELIANNLEIKGAIFNKIKNYSKAVEYFMQAVKVFESNNTTPFPNIYINLCVTNFRMNNFTESIKYGEIAYNLIHKRGSKPQIVNVTNYLSYSYAALGKYPQAHKYLRISYDLYNFLFDEKSDAILAEFSKKYQTEKNEIEIEKQKEIIKYNKLNLMQKKTINTVLIGGILFIAFMFLFIYKQKQKTNKLNKQLILKNNEIEISRKEAMLKNIQLIELDKFKDTITGMIVHDLKNPLNTIINSDNVAYTQQSGRQMLTMVQNILDVQKFEEAKVDINIENESIYSITENALEQVTLLIERKKLNIENNILPEYGVLCDIEKTTRIFINIFTNAIRFTHINGSIIINCDIISENPKKSKDINSQLSFLKISVTDTGIGIRSEKLDKIFDKFEQVSEDNSKELYSYSTGLGLTFCKFAIEAQGGKIGVKSKPNKGSTFWFTLPEGEEINLNKEILPEKILKSKLKFTSSDIKYLQTFVSKLKKFEVYDISEIEKILNNIDSKKSTVINEWKNKMKNALYITDEDLFAELMKL